MAIMYVFWGVNAKAFQSPRQIGPHVLLPAVRIPRWLEIWRYATNTPNNWARTGLPKEKTYGTRSGFPQVGYSNFKSHGFLDSIKIGKWMDQKFYWQWTWLNISNGKDLDGLGSVGGFNSGSCIFKTNTIGQISVHPTRNKHPHVPP